MVRRTDKKLFRDLVTIIGLFARSVTGNIIIDLEGVSWAIAEKFDGNQLVLRINGFKRSTGGDRILPGSVDWLAHYTHSVEPVKIVKHQQLAINSFGASLDK